MKRRNFGFALALMISAGMATTAQAQSVDAGRTAFGAQQAGNADGTIPAYSAEPIGLPACFDPKEPTNFCDPWNDKPLYTITAGNLSQYADKMTEGQKALFKRYPDYRMVVYPTRRTARFPAYYLENTAKNADSCKTTNDGVAITGCYGGVPFPNPQTGNEALWNHQLAYNPPLEGRLESYMIDGAGNRILVNAEDLWNGNPYASDKEGIRSGNDEYFQVRIILYDPPRRNGEQTLIRTNLDGDQRAWQYLPGQRRVKLAPDLTYDTPSPVAGGITTMDQQRLLLGKQDRYDFKLVGVQEKYINYNNFAIYDYNSCTADKLLTKNFPNPDCMRFELHRVLVVEAMLKDGFRHLLPKRVFYLDEDVSGAGTADNYDAAGKLIRIDNMPTIPNYVFGYGMIPDQTLTLDLERGAYMVPSFTAFKGGGYKAVDQLRAGIFDPEDMAAVGIR